MFEKTDLMRMEVLPCGIEVVRLGEYDVLWEAWLLEII